MNTTYTIAEHYDTTGIITAASDPAAEFALWQEQARENPADWTGTEFTIADFEDYIARL